MPRGLIGVRPSRLSHQLRGLAPNLKLDVIVDAVPVLLGEGELTRRQMLLELLSAAIEHVVNVALDIILAGRVKLLPGVAVHGDVLTQ
jgi:hypothetical protein